MNRAIVTMLAPTAELAKTVTATITVEAEYGDTVIEGSRYTAAHHGARAKNPAPCIDAGIPMLEDGDVALISHIDLDTLGGICRAKGMDLVCVNNQAFWRLAAFVDVNGPHKLKASGADERSISDLYAYWAWSQANRQPKLSPDIYHNVSDTVNRHIAILADILGESSEGSLHKAGEAFRTEEARLNQNSFVELVGDVVVRVAPTFVNHLYVAPDGKVGSAVVAFTTTTGAITLSLAEGSDPRNAKDIMQAC